MNYRDRTIQMIDRYLDGEITAREASDWALKLVISKEWDDLASDITNAVQCLLDLHDIDILNASWVPNREEFLKCKEELEKNR
jgi:hypothetical protein